MKNLIPNALGCVVAICCAASLSAQNLQPTTILTGSDSYQVVYQTIISTSQVQSLPQTPAAGQKGTALFLRGTNMTRAAISRSGSNYVHTRTQTTTKFSPPQAPTSLANGLVPLATSAVPLAMGPAPLATGPVPLATSAVPLAMGPAPTATNSVPLAMGPAPLPTKTVPLAMGSAPLATSSVPLAMGPAPIVTKAVPLAMAPVQLPMRPAPMPKAVTRAPLATRAVRDSMSKTNRGNAFKGVPRLGHPRTNQEPAFVAE